MKILHSLILAVTLVCSLAHAQNLTETNTDRARELIAAAVEAHGGSALVNDLHTLRIENETVNYSVDQSRGTEAPWDKSTAHGMDVIDFDQSIFVTVAKNSGGGFEGHNTTMINGEESYQINHRAGTVTRIGQPDFATTSGPFIRVTPAALIRTLNNRAANAYYLGETEVDGESYNVVGFSMTVGPAISMYLEKDTNLLRRSERVFPGFGLVQYEFSDYEESDGIPFNRTFRLVLNGDTNLERSNTSVVVNAPIDEYLAIGPELLVTEAATPDALARYEIADGVWQIGGNGTYAMFVDMGDYIFAAGGTAGIPDRIALLRELVADKPIKYGMLTHHHSDHVLGVPVYESEGAVVIASNAHEKVARAAATDGASLKFKGVADSMTLEAGGRRVEIIDIGPTAHTEHLLVAYLPDEGILFEADHFAMPRVGPIPPAVTSTKTFAAALAARNLTVKTILSAHSPIPGTMEDLATALKTEVFASAR